MDLEDEQNEDHMIELFVIVIIIIFVLYLWSSKRATKPKIKRKNNIEANNDNNYLNYNENNDYNFFNNKSNNIDEGSNNITDSNNYNFINHENNNNNNNYNNFYNHKDKNNDNYNTRKDNNNFYYNKDNYNNYNNHNNNDNYNYNNHKNKNKNNYNNSINNYNSNNNNSINNYNSNNNNSINNFNSNNNYSSINNDNNQDTFNLNINNLKESFKKSFINQNNENENYLGEKFIHFSNKKKKRDEEKIENDIEPFDNIYKNISPKKNTNNNFNFLNNSKEDIYSNEKIRQQNINEIGFLMAEIGEEPQIGLNNIGATCYMNATIQCLSHTVKLTNYFLNPKNEKFINSTEKEFSKEFYEVLKRLWIKQYNNNKNNYSPNKLKEVISKMEPLFQGIAANDSKDLVNFILQQLHSELNLINKKNINNTDYNQINQTDENGMLNYFLNDFKKSNRSIISDIFFGITETKTECLNCKRINLMNGNYNQKFVYNFQIINFLIFPLEEIRKYKNILNYNYYNSNEVNLYDCFDYYQKIETMQGENQMWCNHCGQNSASNYSTSIYSSPEYLILILNRGKGNIYNVKLNFDEVIDIGKYVFIKKGPHLIYHLYAIVTHYGPSSMSGHFIAFCKSPFDNKWYKYNDSIVSLVGDSFKQVNEAGTHYILFYERQE